MTETTLDIERRRVERRRIERRRRLRNLAWASLGALVAAVGLFSLVRALGLRNSVLPGVEVAGEEIGGLSQDEARARIAAVVGDRLSEPVTVQVAKKSFTIEPSKLFAVDAAATEARAFELGRGSFLDRVAAATYPPSAGGDVEPVLIDLPEGQALLAAELEDVQRTAVSARVRMRGTTPVVVSARAGILVDAEALYDDLRAAVLGSDREVKATLRREKPPITNAKAREAAASAETIVSAPVSVRLKRKQIGELRQWQLARLVRFQPVSNGYTIVLDRQGLTRAVEPLAAEHTKSPVDASFYITRKDRVAVVPSKGGTKVAVDAATTSLLAAALSPTDRVAEIGLAKVEADLTTKEALALGIREPVAVYTTDMGASSANRIHNIHLLGDMLDGTLIRPGEVFSFNRVLGPRTPERGFLEGHAIVGGVLVPSIGGGVCQTATTIFNAAFEAGLPIIERHNHAYYISHYPLGRDATVAWDGPDLRFGNDLRNAILIKAWSDDYTFTVAFYGTRQGRKVVATTSERTNFTEPAMLYRIDPNAPAGSVRATTSTAQGFDVTVHRTVYEKGKLLRESDFPTRYTPENPVTIYGPGGGAPAEAAVLPANA